MAAAEAPVPTPRRTPESQPFRDGCRRGVLMLCLCRACERRSFSPGGQCPGCHSTDVQWSEASGKGKLYSYVIAHDPGQEALGSPPRAIAVIELAEGPRVLAELSDFGPDAGSLKVDMPVEVAFHRSGSDLRYSFRPSQP